MNNLTRTLWSLDDHQGARTLSKKVRETCRHVLGPEHPATLTSMNNLAGTLWAMGDYPGARSLLEQVLEAHRRVLGPEHHDTLISMNNLALTLLRMGDAEPALELIATALPIAQARYPQADITKALVGLVEQLRRLVDAASQSPPDPAP